MANYQLLALIKSDISRWNQWRKDNLHADIDLIGADLSGLNLKWADLRDANLLGADLKHTNLSGADLRWANLSQARLIGADLRGANLCFTQLHQADLTEANLRGSDLREAEFRSARLERTDLTGALLSPPSHLPGKPWQQEPTDSTRSTILEPNSASADLEPQNEGTNLTSVEPLTPTEATDETLELPADVLQKLIASAQLSSEETSTEAEVNPLESTSPVQHFQFEEQSSGTSETLADWMQE